MIPLNVPAELAQDIEKVCAEWEQFLAPGILERTRTVVHDFEACRYAADATDDASVEEWDRGAMGRLADVLYRLHQELDAGVYRGEWHRDVTDEWMARQTA